MLPYEIKIDLFLKFLIEPSLPYYFAHLKRETQDKNDLCFIAALWAHL